MRRECDQLMSAGVGSMSSDGAGAAASDCSSRTQKRAKICSWTWSSSSIGAEKAEEKSGALEDVDDLDEVRDSGVGVERRNGSELLEEALVVDADRE